MLKLQLRGEIAGSIAGNTRHVGVNPTDDVLALLEARKGYGDFRIVLPNRVTWSEKAAAIHGRLGAQSLMLEDAIRVYQPDDRKLVVDMLTSALETRSGFSFVARIVTPQGEARTIECLGDVTMAGQTVTGVFGLVRDISRRVEKEAMAISRARLIRHMVEDIPVPVVVLDRALRVVGCSSEWAKAYGLAGRKEALGQPLGSLVEVSRETTSAIIEALGGHTATLGLWFYSGEDSRQVRRNCAVIPWQCGTDEPGGVIMVIGGGESNFATLEIADRAMGRSAKGLLALLETIERPVAA